MSVELGRQDCFAAVVAIPVRNERDHIVACLRALGKQSGLIPASLGVLLFLNNCSDGTAEAVAAVEPAFPCPCA